MLRDTGSVLVIPGSEIAFYEGMLYTHEYLLIVP